MNIECANASVKLKCKQEEPIANQLHTDNVGGQYCVAKVYMSMSMSITVHGK